MKNQSSVSRSRILQTLLLPIFVLAFVACTVSGEVVEIPDSDGLEEVASMEGLPTATASSPTPETEILPTATMSLADTTITPAISPTPFPTLTPTPSITLVWNDSFPPTGLVNDMAVVADDDIWSVGVQGYISHWDGVGWTTITSPITTTLNGVDFISATDGWAVGNGGLIAHWDGDSWKIIRPYTPAKSDGSLAFSYLEDVDFITPTDGWAVGSWSHQGGGSSLILRWDGQGWQEANYTPDDLYACSCPLYSVTMLATDDVWAVGSSTENLMTRSPGIFHWDGQTWQLMVTTIESTAFLFTVNGSATDNVWAAGIENSSYDMSYFGITLRWDGQRWEEIPYPLERGWLNSILMLSKDDGWLVGGVNRVFHWDGVEWIEIVNEITESIAEVAVTPSGKIIGITGDGTLLELTLEGVRPWPVSD